MAVYRAEYYGLEETLIATKMIYEMYLYITWKYMMTLHFCPVKNQLDFNILRPEKGYNFANMIFK